MNKFYSLGLLTSMVSLSLSKALNAALADNNIDLPHSQFVVLRILYFYDGISQLEIANVISKDAAAIKRTVDNLEAKGLVIRKQVRALKNSVCITETGRQLMPKVLEIAQSVIDRAFEGFSEESRADVTSMLATMYQNIEQKPLGGVLLKE